MQYIGSNVSFIHRLDLKLGSQDTGFYYKNGVGNDDKFLLTIWW